MLSPLSMMRPRNTEPQEGENREGLKKIEKKRKADQSPCATSSSGRSPRHHQEQCSCTHQIPKKRKKEEKKNPRMR